MFIYKFTKGCQGSQSDLLYCRGITCFTCFSLSCPNRRKHRGDKPKSPPAQPSPTPTCADLQNSDHGRIVENLAGSGRVAPQLTAERIRPRLARARPGFSRIGAIGTIRTIGTIRSVRTVDSGGVRPPYRIARILA